MLKEERKEGKETKGPSGQALGETKVETNSEQKHRQAERQGNKGTEDASGRGRLWKGQQ